MAGGVLRIAALVATCALVGCENPFGSERRAPATGYYEVVATQVAADGRTVAGFNKRGDFVIQDGSSAFRHSDGVLTQLLGVAGATAVTVAGMNENGVVIGRSGTIPVRWAAGAATPDQAPLTNRPLTDINNAGDAIFESGYYSQAASRDTAFIVWNAAGAIETINSMAVSQSGGFGFLYARGLNDSREVLVSVVQLHSWVQLLSSLQRPAPDGGACAWATQIGAVALNDSGAYIQAAGSSQQCLVRPGKPLANLATFTTSRTRFNNNFWMAGDDKSGAGPVLATHPDTVVKVADLFEREIDRAGWTIESFVALNDNNEVLAVATKNGAREFVVLKPRQ